MKQINRKLRVPIPATGDSRDRWQPLKQNANEI